jgi:hypothetical protein
LGERLNPFGEPLPERQGITARFHPRREVGASLAPFYRAAAQMRHFHDVFPPFSASLFENRIPVQFFTPLRVFRRSSTPDGLQAIRQNIALRRKDDLID